MGITLTQRKLQRYLRKDSTKSVGFQLVSTHRKVNCSIFNNKIAQSYSYLALPVRGFGLLNDIKLLKGRKRKGFKIEFRQGSQ